MKKMLVGEETKLFNLLQGHWIQKNHYYCHCNIFQMVNIPDHANSNVNKL